MLDYWQQQSPDHPLFPDLLWSRPQNKAQAGKLLIIGGNAQGFAAVAEAYSVAESSGIGTARVLLPDSLQKTVGRIFVAGEYAPSTPSGSLARQALAEILDTSSWCDAVLLAGDLGRNSETAILLEKFVSKYTGPLILAKDAIDYFTAIPSAILDRPATTIVANLGQLQKIVKNSRFPVAVRSDMDLTRLVEVLHQFTKQKSISIVTMQGNKILVADEGRVSSTNVDQKIWQVQTATTISVWQIQNPKAIYEAMTSAVMTLTGAETGQ